MTCGQEEWLPLPPFVQEAAARLGAGSPGIRYTAARPRVVLMVCRLVGFALVGVFVVRAAARDAAEWTGLGLLARGAIVLMAAFCLVACVRAGRSLIGSGRGLYVFDRGLVAARWTNRALAVSWDDAAVRTDREVVVDTNTGVDGHRTLSLTVRGPGAVAVRLEAEMSDKIEAVASLVQQRILDVQLPRAIEEVEQGGAVVLGPVTLRATGIQVHRRTWSWAEFDRVESNVDGVRLYTTSRSRRSAVKVRNVPNEHVLVALTVALRHRHGDRHG